MNKKYELLGCFISSMNGDENGDLFRNYISGENGISNLLKTIKNEDYGKDLILIL